MLVGGICQGDYVSIDYSLSGVEVHGDSVVALQVRNEGGEACHRVHEAGSVHVVRVSHEMQRVVRRNLQRALVGLLSSMNRTTSMLVMLCSPDQSA